MYKILVVDDEKSVRYSFRKLFAGSRYTMYEAENFESAMESFKEIQPDIAIVDIEMPGKNGLELLKEIKTHYQETPVIMVTAYGSGDRVIKAMKHGAYDYVEKPFDIPYLFGLIDEALKASQPNLADNPSHHSSKTLKKPNSEDKIIGDSPAIKEVFKLIGKVAASDASILITGESGTGKELVAKAIHTYSDRAAKPFIAMNCAAIPETLLESELFGYKKGAFTGANKDKPGKFEEAHSGTLFLDEIGDMSLPLQAKLLRVLQEGSFERLGSAKTQFADVRIITATNSNLESLIQKKEFREDLFYRIRVITIALPPLRLRKEDIPALAHHFLQKHVVNEKLPPMTIHTLAMEKMLEYSWPGNIRQLENTIKRAVILAKGPVLTADLLLKEFEPVVNQTNNQPFGLNYYLNAEFEKREGEIYQLVLREVEKELIVWALNKSGKNQVKAAKLLGISRVMLHERMEKFGIFKS